MMMPDNNPAARAYIRRFTPTMIAYVVFLFGAVYAMRHWHPEGPLLVILAVLPALPLIGVVWAVGMFIVEQQDEYLRMRQIRQVLVATAFLLSVSSVWGFLEVAKLVPHIEMYFAFIIWCFGLMLEPVTCWFGDRRGGGE